MRGATSFFPEEWLCTVTFSRGGGRDKWGSPLPTVTFSVEMCLFEIGRGPEEAGFLHTEGVEALIHTPPGVDVRHDDTGAVPASAWLPRPVKFSVSAMPKHTPLGVTVPVRLEA